MVYDSAGHLTVACNLLEIFANPGVVIHHIDLRIVHDFRSGIGCVVRSNEEIVEMSVRRRKQYIARTNTFSKVPTVRGVLNAVISSLSERLIVLTPVCVSVGVSRNVSQKGVTYMSEFDR